MHMGFMKAEDSSVGALVACLERGGTVATQVHDPEQSAAAGPVYLQPGDQECSGCEALIDGDEYPGAAWASVLARQKIQYGHTMCRGCHEAVTE